MLKSKLIAIFGLALFFSYLFYKQNIGLNFLLFEFAGLTLLFYYKQIDIKNSKIQFALVGFCLSISSFVWNFSAFALTVNLIFSIYLIGLCCMPIVKNNFNGLILGVSSSLMAPFAFLKLLNKSFISKNSLIRKIWNAKIYIIPLIIAILFIAIYRSSNPYFNSIVLTIEKYSINKFPNIFNYINEDWLFLFMLGFLLSIIILLRTTFNLIAKNDEETHFELRRFKKHFRYKFNSNTLLTEAKVGIVLFIILNVLLLVFNSFDIYYVWLKFKWDGTILKQFVHEGTYLLIFSILLSVVIVLYYFRANQNFNPKNKLIKQLAVIWIVQNIVLCISVGIRNYWYIDYFNLAYKRIGVIIFLIITIYGLFTVYLKVRDKNTISYILHKNTAFIMFILLIGSLFNWDVIIAKYNFRNADKAYLHLEFMHSLSDKTLPYLDKSINELNKIKKTQAIIYNFEDSYMSSEDYYKIITERKEKFLQIDNEIDWRSWNFAEYKARKLLKQ